MKRVFMVAASAAVLLGLAAAVPAAAQSNNDDYTPLGSRIRHDRQFPYDPRANEVPLDKMSKVQKDLSRDMQSEFSKCIYNRSKTGSVGLLDKTDFGFVNFEQIGLTPDKAAVIYGFHDCLGRVADRNETGVEMHYNAPSLRQWIIQAAYLETYPKGPTWVKPGYVIDPRTYPLSQANPRVRQEMDFADCVVAADPNNSDYFFRTVGGSPAEKEALDALTPSLGPCLPQGQRVQLDQATLHVLLGEALWHAANHSSPAPADAPKTPG